MHYLAQVTRTVIRKCVSADGTEMPPDGGSQGSVAIAEGDGYSKVVKRTVVKSEGDDTEVCILYTMHVFIHLTQSTNSLFNSKYLM